MKRNRGMPPDGAAEAVSKPKREVVVERLVQFRASDGTMHDSYHAAVRASTDAALAEWLGHWFMKYGITTAEPHELAAALRAEYNLTRRKK